MDGKNASFILCSLCGHSFVTFVAFLALVIRIAVAPISERPPLMEDAALLRGLPAKELVVHHTFRPLHGLC